MALVELRQGLCDTCGADLVLHVYWPYVMSLQRLLEAGGLAQFDQDDLAVIFDDAAEADAYEQADGGEVAMARALALSAGGLFVDTREEFVVTCPECKALIGVVARRREG